MRQWNINPRLLCDQHLLGEHVEAHMFIGTARKNKTRLVHFIAHRLVNPRRIVIRHDKLVKEMERRGMNHSTPMMPEDIELCRTFKDFPVPDSTSLLSERCDDCRERINAQVL